MAFHYFLPFDATELLVNICITQHALDHFKQRNRFGKKRWKIFYLFQIIYEGKNICVCMVKNDICSLKWYKWKICCVAFERRDVWIFPNIQSLLNILFFQIANAVLVINNKNKTKIKSTK